MAKILTTMTTATTRCLRSSCTVTMTSTADLSTWSRPRRQVYEELKYSFLIFVSSAASVFRHFIPSLLYRQAITRTQPVDPYPLNSGHIGTNFSARQGLKYNFQGGELFSSSGPLIRSWAPVYFLSPYFNRGLSNYQRLTECLNVLSIISCCFFFNFLVKAINYWITIAQVANFLGPGTWVPAVKSNNFAAGTLQA